MSKVHGMDSPKREQCLPPCGELQGSPLFKFLCSLSPIKQAKSAHVAQTYSELSFPAPLPVFVSPKKKREDARPSRDAENEASAKVAPGHPQDATTRSERAGPKQAATTLTGLVTGQGDEDHSPECPASHKESAAEPDTDIEAANMEKLAICGGLDDQKEVTTQDSLRTGKSQRGGRRRCLDFQSDSQGSNAENASCIISPGVSSMLSQDATYATTPTSASGPDSLTAIVSSLSGSDCSESCKKLMREAVPPGIGLHLNSLGLLTGPRGVSLLSCSQGMQAGDGFTLCGHGPGLLVSVVEKTSMEQEVQGAAGSQEGLLTSTTCVRSLTLGIQAVEEGVPFGMEQVVTPGRKRLSMQSESADGEIGRTPKKKRKSLGDKGDGCKRCHCKKSKCLKLYCECFAAGVYCLDSCACRDCFNKPEFADTVMGTRQQIETRNPLAFAPKIVQTSESTPAEGVSCPDTTAASARHKRGCNCKKSLCLKKYCECYQAGVGCSDGCKCNGCKNIYGVKRVQDEAEPLDDQLQLNHSSITSLSPITPTLVQHASAVLPSGSTNTPSSTTPATSKLMDSSGLAWEETPEFLRAGRSSPRTMLNELLSDETPEFLRAERSSPRSGIKGSPKQKRVAPPNAGGEAASSSSSVLKSGRKLTLQSLPSLPPVTPFSFPQQGYKRSS